MRGASNRSSCRAVERGAQSGGGAMDRVALGHGASLPTSWRSQQPFWLRVWRVARHTQYKALVGGYLSSAPASTGRVTPVT